MNILQLREKVKLLPAKPGCYIMKDCSGVVIYVGKAKRLSSRVKSYFDNSPKTQKTYALVKNIDNFEYIITNSEQDAFNLENNLIKKYKPKYNILLKDDKAFPYIKIDMAEKFPRVQVVRRPKPDGSKLFGPYVTGIPISELMHIIKSAFPVRWCNKKFEKVKLPTKCCLHGQIGHCLAPCSAAEKEQEYKQNLLKIMDFLNGDNKEVRQKLQQRMQAAAQKQDFETALDMRNALAMLDRMESKIITSLAKNYNADVFAYWDNPDSDLAAINVMTIRAGQNVGQFNYAVPGVVGSPSEVISSFMVDYYSGGVTPPSEIISKQTEPQEAESLQLYFLEHHSKVVKVVCPQKGIKNQLAESSLKNAQEYAERSADSISRHQRLTSGALERLAELLNLGKVYRIEGYDISDISGTNNVASMVVFEGGEPAKSQYRKYKIKTVEGANDFACLQEALTRRLTRLASGDNQFGAKPDVILIDGGLGQLNAVSEVARGLALNIAFISLAKKDELIYTTTSNQPIALPKSDYALRLLQRVRDESHRFAVTFHRSVRGAKELMSVLGQIDGIGKAKQKALYEHFKTIDAISSASPEALCEVEGIGKKHAINIYNFFNKDSKK